MFTLFESREKRALRKLNREQERIQKNRNQRIRDMAFSLFQNWVQYLDPEDVTKAEIDRLAGLSIVAAQTILDAIDEVR